MRLPDFPFPQQYDYVRSSRAVLLDYCGTLAPADFIRENSAFGKGSIRNLLVHIANTYAFWLGEFSLGRAITYTEPGDLAEVAGFHPLFAGVDQLVSDFLDYWSAETPALFTAEFDGQQQQAPPLQLFTHVITHEYHHKGQILSLSRHLGYVPVDTDVMR
ncbi:MAG: DinB family protein [Lewinella sp.]|nr:DinB family protein [Lewinella sp.]